MDLNLKGKKVLVTGASKGIGAAAAKLFAKEGCDLRLAARNEAALRESAEALSREFDVACDVHVVDLRDSGGLTALGAAASDIDILLNNAGDIPAGNLFAIDELTWRHAWELKVFGYINLTRLIYPQLKARGGGVILNNIGAAAERAMPNYICGATGNAALAAFTRSLGSTSMKDNVRVLGVNPGPVTTDRLTSQMHKLPMPAESGDRKSATSALPAGRAATVEEIADVLVFLASARANYVSGTVVTVNGGGGLPA